MDTCQGSESWGRAGSHPATSLAPQCASPVCWGLLSSHRGMGGLVAPSPLGQPCLLHRLLEDAMSGEFLHDGFALPCPPGLQIPEEDGSALSPNTLKVPELRLALGPGCPGVTRLAGSESLSVWVSGGAGEQALGAEPRAGLTGPGSGRPPLTQVVPFPQILVLAGCFAVFWTVYYLLEVYLSQRGMASRPAGRSRPCHWPQRSRKAREEGTELESVPLCDSKRPGGVGPESTGPASTAGLRAPDPLDPGDWSPARPHQHLSPDLPQGEEEQVC